MGSPQVINCTVSTVSGVEASSVMINWMGPGGEFITNDSRVTISPTTSSGSNYTNSLQFTYLMEGDEGNYICNMMILETRVSQSVELQSLTSKLFTNLFLFHFTPLVVSRAESDNCVGVLVKVQCLNYHMITTIATIITLNILQCDYINQCPIT